MYKTEVLEGDGKQVIMVIDLMEGPMPSLNEIKAQVKMFSGILGRTFPRIFIELVILCTWGVFSRKAVTTLARSAGLAGSFVEPEDLIKRIGAKYVPTLTGGTLDLSTQQPMGRIIEDFYSGNSDVPCRNFQLGNLNVWKDDTPYSEVIVDMGDPDSNRVPSWTTLMESSLKLSNRRSLYPTKNPNSMANLLSTSSVVDNSLALTSAGIVLVSAMGILGNYYLFLLSCAVLRFLFQIYRTTLDAWRASIEELRRQNTISSEGRIERMLCYILEKEYEECMNLLQPMALYVDLQNKSTRAASHNERCSLALCTTLSKTEKDRVKRCVQAVLDISALSSNQPFSSGPSLRWLELYGWLQTITTLVIPCKCGCQQSGNMDWMDSHLLDGGESHRRVSHYLANGSPDEDPLTPNTGSATFVKEGAHKKVDVNEANDPAPGSPVRPRIDSSMESKKGYDKKSKQCAVCTKSFSMTRRRHWCRACQRTICARCSAVPLSHLKRKHPQCVCKSCQSEGRTVIETGGTEAGGSDASDSEDDS
eukprot:NODE_1708_length_1840_cov_51.798486_g1449_i0.p1 GENE.NODE_1708_length_1840_cov_51.798486_g1449_i0~~NODE_1708_length_1840_cov_51.798486_g1449_i0.p1  ORF type:complete len:574 (-),score=86.81 NODE_1708_length_1840_cov_51.798486_g1449_i0:117-1718(-)